MRIALLSMTERAGDEPETPIGALSLAGMSLAERQLDLALALGCERIVCLAGGLDKLLIALQHRAEAADAKFSLIPGPRALLGLVSATDELVIMAEGLLPAAGEAQTALESGKGVLVLPVEAGIAAGFERIDLNYAWAGVLAMPGRLVERLSELPSDCDTISALLRIALQGGVPERILPDAALSEGRWALLRTRRQLAEMEPDWFRRHASAPTPCAPGRALARLAMRSLGGKLLGKGLQPAVLSLGGIALAGIGLAAAWFGQSVPGIAAAGLGWLLCEAGSALGAIARAGFGRRQRQSRLVPAAGWLLDLCLVTILALSLEGVWQERLFAPIMLVGLARLAGGLIGLKWAEILQDRAVLCAILALAAAFAQLSPAIDALSVLLLALLLGLASRIAQITRA